MNDPLKHLNDLIDYHNKKNKLEIMKEMKEGIEIAFNGIQENAKNIVLICKKIDELQFAVKKLMEKA
jgi:hypothetical protein